jgi:hypothetical protein
MNILVAALSAFSLFAALTPAQSAKVLPEDLRRLTGARWAGTLTYTDYGSNKRVSIPSTLTVTEATGDASSWVFEYAYPDEPKANGKQTVKLDEGGTRLDGETVVERTSLDDGLLRIVTERRGTDNDKPALFRYTYLIGASSFSVKKEVRYEGASEFFERNVYSWSR